MGRIGKKERFLKVYANLPLNLRDGIVSVVDGKPITWNVVYLEVVNKTKIGKEVLNKLATLKII